MNDIIREEVIKHQKLHIQMLKTMSPEQFLEYIETKFKPIEEK